uniref:Uncharacterized protein n=1 Tax=Sphaeramia orbicularis TaxID=375764 RepID=A0A673BES4_9TELE
MQQSENGSAEEATVDVQFTDLPNALIACKVPEELFNEGSLKTSFEALFRSFDPAVQVPVLQVFPSGPDQLQRRAAAAEARLRLHKSNFNGKEMRLYFAQVRSADLWTRVPKQFLISPPASPPVGWEQSQDATPVINYDLLCAISKLGPGDKYELHTATPTTPASAPDDSDQDEKPPPPRGPRSSRTRRPDYTPGVKQ